MIYFAIFPLQSKRKYDQASEDADQAMKAYEQASQSLDLTKAQILKVYKIFQTLHGENW